MPVAETIKASKGTVFDDIPIEPFFPDAETIKPSKDAKDIQSSHLLSSGRPNTLVGSFVYCGLFCISVQHQLSG